MNQISQETKLLCTNHIETSEQLFSYHDEKKRLLEKRMHYRKNLRYQLRAKTRPETEKAEIQKKICILNQEIATLRKEVGLCEDIAKRSEVIRDKPKITRNEPQKMKGDDTNEHIR